MIAVAALIALQQARAGLATRAHVATEKAFLKLHHRTMPRTALRYAIEKFPEKERRAYLTGLS